MDTNTDIKYHHAQINFEIMIPDGVYVPEEFQFSDTEMRMVYRDNPIHGDSIIVSVEVHDYILSILKDMGVVLRGSSISDAYGVDQ